MTVYVLVGHSCTGKTTARRYLERRGFVGYEASEVVKRRLTSHRIQDVAEMLKQFGRDIIARDLLSLIESCVPTVISGFRTPEEIQCLRKAHKAVVIGLIAPHEVSYARSCQRGRDSYPDLASFSARQLVPDERLGLAQVMAEADVTLDNVSDLQTLYDELDAVFEEGYA